MISLEEARRIADGYASRTGSKWFDREVEERASYWVFRIGFIGSMGIVVDKTDGGLTVLGSAFELDDWLWGYERGLLAVAPKLRVLAVHDLDATIEFLLQLPTRGPVRRPNPNPRRAWLRTELRHLPAEFACEGHLGLAIPSFREVAEAGWFEFDVVAVAD